MSEFDDTGDGWDWARKLMRRHAAGEKINRYPLHAAREVLYLPEPARVHHAHPSVGPANGPATAPFEPPRGTTPAEAFYAAEARACGVDNEEVTQI